MQPTLNILEYGWNKITKNENSMKTVLCISS